LMTVAKACTATFLDSDSTLKDCSLTSCETDGSGTPLPGVGKPGIGGTIGIAVAFLTN
jgi:hypothetical protein